MISSEPITTNTPEQRPFAIVNGDVVTQAPTDLYIPPDALEVFLEAFEGPLDLLLYLIKRQNVNILDIPVAEITTQYIQYIELMKELRLELAAEYLVMAAMLAEIKSRMLLPRPATVEEEDDPRAELMRRLQEYERFKQAAENLDELPREQREFFVAAPVDVHTQTTVKHPAVSMDELLGALRDVMARADMFTSHHIRKDALSVRERMSQILADLCVDRFTDFTTLFAIHEGRPGLVVTFLAMLELIKASLIEIVQTEPYGPIHVKAISPIS